MLQVVVDNLDSAINALNGKIDELMLCSPLSGGGLTPSAKFVSEVLKLVNNHSGKCPKVHVSIRCRGGDDFLYSDLEMTTMLRDIQQFNGMNVAGFVFGALTESLRIDEKKCLDVLNMASPKLVTFSKAIDLAPEYKCAVADAARLGFRRVQTAGGCKDVTQPGAMLKIMNVINRYKNSELRVVASGGLDAGNLLPFVLMGCHVVQVTIPTPKDFCAGKKSEFSSDGTAQKALLANQKKLTKLKACFDESVRKWNWGKIFLIFTFIIMLMCGYLYILIISGFDMTKYFNMNSGFPRINPCFKLFSEK